MRIPEGYQKENDCACGLNSYRNDLISDSILGLSIKEACCIHDWMYGTGRSIRDREIADSVFLENMLELIEKKPSWRITKYFRKKIAFGYYEGVRRIGGFLFWRNKRPEDRGVFEGAHAS